MGELVKGAGVNEDTGLLAFDEVKSFFADSQPSVSDIQLKWRLGYSRALAIKEALFS